MSVDKTLIEREAVYGDYLDGLHLRGSIMKAINKSYEFHHNKRMPDEFQGMIWDVLNKLCRIAVTPDHIDSWHDIQGYAKRSEEILRREQDAVEKSR